MNTSQKDHKLISKGLRIHTWSNYGSYQRSVDILYSDHYTKNSTVLFHACWFLDTCVLCEQIFVQFLMFGYCRKRLLRMHASKHRRKCGEETPLLNSTSSETSLASIHRALCCCESCLLPPPAASGGQRNHSHVLTNWHYNVHMKLKNQYNKLLVMWKSVILLFWFSILILLLAKNIYINLYPYRSPFMHFCLKSLP